VWLEASSSDEHWQFREDHLDWIGELQPGETVAMRFSDYAIRLLVREANHDLYGTTPAYFASPYVLFHNSTSGNAAIKRVVTGFRGWVTGPSVDDFEVTLTDRLWLEGAKLRCSTAAAVDMENESYTLASVLDQILDFDDPDSPLHDLSVKGPGCQIAGAAPDQVMLPGSFQFLGGRVARKEVFDYTRLVVEHTIALGGTHRTTARYPQASIEGPSSVQAEIGEPPSATYRVVTADLRAPLTIAWSAPGATIVRNGTQATITWPTPPSMGVQRAITVTVSDADGLTKSATKNVLVKRPTGAHVGN
jgi:hypothetical protein